jgi:hypothetical protein
VQKIACQKSFVKRRYPFNRFLKAFVTFFITASKRVCHIYNNSQGFHWSFSAIFFYCFESFPMTCCHLC